MTVLVGCAAGEPRAVPPTDTAASVLVDAALDSTIEHAMRDGGLVGMAAALIVKGEVVYSRGFGYANRETQVPFTPQTVMNVASIAKTVTGVALMRAVQEGRLSLDEDINRYLPFRVVNPHRPGARITLRHIATQTSGITDRMPFYTTLYHYGGDAPRVMPEVLREYFVPGGRHYARDNFLPKDPGQVREYSNIASALAGYIVELVNGEPLNTWTRTHIFAPLRMTRTGWFLSEVDSAAHARLYEPEGDSLRSVPLYGLVTYPEGGLRTSVEDLSRFFLALLRGGTLDGARILEASTVAEMTRLQWTADHKPENESLDEKNSGIFWATKFNTTRVGHGGHDPGVSAEMLTNHARDIGVVMISNTSLDARSGAAFNAILEALWARGEQARGPGAVPAGPAS